MPRGDAVEHEGCEVERRRVSRIVQSSPRAGEPGGRVLGRADLQLRPITGHQVGEIGEDALWVGPDAIAHCPKSLSV